MVEAGHGFPGRGFGRPRVDLPAGQRGRAVALSGAQRDKNPPAAARHRERRSEFSAPTLGLHLSGRATEGSVAKCNRLQPPASDVSSISLRSLSRFAGQSHRKNSPQQSGLSPRCSQSLGHGGRICEAIRSPRNLKRSSKRLPSGSRPSARSSEQSLSRKSGRLHAAHSTQGPQTNPWGLGGISCFVRRRVDVIR